MKGVRFVNTVQIKIIVIYVLLILMAMQLIGIYFVRTMENSFVDNFTQSLYNRVDLLSQYVKQSLKVSTESGQDDETLQQDLYDVVDNFNKISGAEIQIIDSTAQIISTSGDRSLIGKKKTQPEITQALQGFSYEEKVLDKNVRKLAIAMPVKDADKVIGAVYVLSSMEEIYGTIDSITRIFIVGMLIAIVLTALLGIILANTITNPIKEMTRKATQMAEGNFNQRVAVMGNDEISQLGRAFNYMIDRLREALSSNEEEKEKLASILSNMSDGVIATDDLGRVIVINRRARLMLRRHETSVMGREIADLLGMKKEQIDDFVLGENNTVLVNFPVDEGEELVVRVTFTPIHRRGKGITGTIIVLHDVTEQEKLEGSRREFVANVSHELRTPLTTINSYIEALDEGAVDDPSMRQRFISVVRNETERMIRLVSDLLHLSRLDSKQSALRKEPTLIADMLEEVADRFSFQLQQRSIDIRLEVADACREEPVMIDRDQIDQVLDNLVSNAVKYTTEGGHITIRAHCAANDAMEVVIADTGIGIPKKDLERIFERFYRVDKARSRSMGGTGLGLSIAREIIKAHGGSIHIDSELNKGTTVSFLLPYSVRRGSESA